MEGNHRFAFGNDRCSEIVHHWRQPTGPGYTKSIRIGPHAAVTGPERGNQLTTRNIDDMHGHQPRCRGLFSKRPNPTKMARLPQRNDGQAMFGRSLNT